jgi:hypothetical protein
MPPGLASKRRRRAGLPQPHGAARCAAITHHYCVELTPVQRTDPRWYPDNAITWDTFIANAWPSAKKVWATRGLWPTRGHSRLSENATAIAGGGWPVLVGEGGAGPTVYAVATTAKVVADAAIYSHRMRRHSLCGCNHRRRLVGSSRAR